MNVYQGMLGVAGGSADPAMGAPLSLPLDSKADTSLPGPLSFAQVLHRTETSPPANASAKPAAAAATPGTASSSVPEENRQAGGGNELHQQNQQNRLDASSCNSGKNHHGTGASAGLGRNASTSRAKTTGPMAGIAKSSLDRTISRAGNLPLSPASYSAERLNSPSKKSKQVSIYDKYALEKQKQCLNKKSASMASGIPAPISALHKAAAPEMPIAAAAPTLLPSASRSLSADSPGADLSGGATATKLLKGTKPLTGIGASGAALLSRTTQEGGTSGLNGTPGLNGTTGLMGGSAEARRLAGLTGLAGPVGPVGLTGTAATKAAQKSAAVDSSLGKLEAASLGLAAQSGDGNPKGADRRVLEKAGPGSSGKPTIDAGQGAVPGTTARDAAIGSSFFSGLNSSGSDSSGSGSSTSRSANSGSSGSAGSGSGSGSAASGFSFALAPGGGLAGMAAPGKSGAVATLSGASLPPGISTSIPPSISLTVPPGAAGGISSAGPTPMAAHASPLSAETALRHMDAASGAASGRAGGLGQEVRVANARQLEVGVGDAANGFVRVRAEMGAGGVVEASLAAGSVQRQYELRADLPAISSYLSQQHLAPGGVKLAPIFSHEVAGTVATGGGMAGAGHEGAGNGGFNGTGSTGLDSGGAGLGAQQQPGDGGGTHRGSGGGPVGLGSAAAAPVSRWDGPAGFGGGFSVRV